MKKSFIIAGIFLGILVVSLVSAGLFDGITGKAIWDWNHCSSSNQCPASEGDCDSDSECKTGYCEYNVGKKYGQNALMDVCECPSGTTWDGIKCSLDIPSGDGNPSCGYIHYKDSLPNGDDVSGMTILEICAVEENYTPIYIVINQYKRLTNSEDCSSSYTIFGSESSIIRPYSSIYSNVKLGEFAKKGECSKATFPDGSVIGDGFSAITTQSYEAVLCCSY